MNKSEAISMLRAGFDVANDSVTREGDGSVQTFRGGDAVDMGVVINEPVEDEWYIVVPDFNPDVEGEDLMGY